MSLADTTVLEEPIRIGPAHDAGATPEPVRIGFLSDMPTAPALGGLDEHDLAIRGNCIVVHVIVGLSESAAIYQGGSCGG